MLLALKPLQELLYRLITAPGGVSEGLAEERARSRGDLDALIRGDARLSAVDHLDIYANMYFYRLLDILKEDYPATLAVVGPDNFHNLATGYLLVNRPHHPSLLYAGAHLPDFLQTHPLRAAFAFLPDLARLERAETDVFVAPDAAALDETAMRAVAPERWAAFPLRTHPAVQTLDLKWQVGGVVRAVQDGAQWHAPGHAAVTVLVWRMHGRTYLRDLDAFERAALRAARDGAPFANICEHAAQALPSIDAPARIASMLARWLADGLIVAA